MVFCFQGVVLVVDCEDLEELIFLIVFVMEIMQDFVFYEFVLKYLKEVMGKKINFFMLILWVSVIEVMMNKFVDIVVYGFYFYIFGNEKDKDIEVFVMYVKKVGYIIEEGLGYKCVIIMKKGSKFIIIEFLEGSIVVLVDLVSIFGNFILCISFVKVINMFIENYFKKIIYFGGYDLLILVVQDGKVDVVFVVIYCFDEVINCGKVKKEDFNYFWFFEFIFGDFICYCLLFCFELRKKIEDVFLNLYNVLGVDKYLKNVKVIKMVRMISKDYDIIRELKKVKDVFKKN